MSPFVTSQRVPGLFSRDQTNKVPCHFLEARINERLGGQFLDAPGA